MFGKLGCYNFDYKMENILVKKVFVCLFKFKVGSIYLVVVLLQTNSLFVLLRLALPDLLQREYSMLLLFCHV